MTEPTLGEAWSEVWAAAHPPVPIGPPLFTLTPTQEGVKVPSIQGDR